MKHSCGHPATKGTPKDVVRAQPRCTPCARRVELIVAINTRIDVLARMWPYTPRSELERAVWWRSVGKTLDQVLERAVMFVENGLDSQELKPFLSQRELSEMEYHAMTGD